MLLIISSQMTSNYQALQENIVKNDQCLSTNIQPIAHEMDMFKQQLRAKIDTLRNIVPQAHCSVGSNSNNISVSVPSSPQNLSNQVPSTHQVNPTLNPNSSPSLDFRPR
jgi:hypothetical protein